jgi:hypothetical protein
MISSRAQLLRGPHAEAATLARVAVVTVVALIALDTDPVTIFWALTAGLPLIAFVTVVVVVLARGRSRPADQPDER